MVIKGNNLIISGQTASTNKILVASKSCDITVDAEVANIAPTSNEMWKAIMAMRKSWKVTTNHLLALPVEPDFWVKATASAGVSESTVSVTTPNGTATSTMKGLNLFSIAENAAPTLVLHVDTYGLTEDDYTTKCEYFRQQLISIAGQAQYPHLVIVSNYEYGIDADLAAALEDTLGVATNLLTTGRFTTKSLIIISGRTMSAGSAYTIEQTADHIESEKMLMNGGAVMQETVLKDAIDKVGSSFSIRVQLDIPGLVPTPVKGDVICTAWHVVGNIESLAQGTFSFQGNGPLQ